MSFDPEVLKNKRTAFKKIFGERVLFRLSFAIPSATLLVKEIKEYRYRIIVEENGVSESFELNDLVKINELIVIFPQLVEYFFNDKTPIQREKYINSEFDILLDFNEDYKVDEKILESSKGILDYIVKVYKNVFQEVENLDGGMELNEDIINKIHRISNIFKDDILKLIEKATRNEVVNEIVAKIISKLIEIDDIDLMLFEKVKKSFIELIFGNLQLYYFSIEKPGQKIEDKYKLRLLHYYQLWRKNNLTLYDFNGLLELALKLTGKLI